MDLSPAYILHRRPYSNTSLLLDIFSLNGGRFSAISRGSRAARGQGNCLQPFVPLHISWKGRGAVKTLIKYEASSGALFNKGDLLYCGIYLNELMTRLLSQHDEHPGLFAYYSLALQQLADADIKKDIVLRYFELALLQELGYPLDLQQDTAGQPILSQKCYRYVEEQGMSLSSSSQSSISGSTLLALQRQTLGTKRLCFEARQLLRQVLSYYLGDKPLMSRQFFMPIKKQD